ncbi:MAG: DUF4097 domain-containing protein [Coriobacteriia bacterium]|nr:DUF4097 domain-containing protein [Coriobacteriia bacterium]
MSEPRRLSGGAWARIILVLILCLMVVLALLVGTTGISNCTNALRYRTSFTIDNRNWEVGSGSTSVSNLHGINVDWLYGDVKINTSDKNVIEIIDHPTSSARIDQVHWVVENGILYVVSNEPRVNINILPTWGSHTCEILIPKNLAQGLNSMDLTLASGSFRLNGFSSSALKMDVLSGNFYIDNTEARTSTITVASGSLTSTNFTAQTLKLDLLSGKTDLFGSFNSLTTTTASGTLNIHSKTAPASIKAELLSGNTTFSFPNPSGGFTAQVDRVSGTFNCGFSTTQRNGAYVNGNGFAKYSFHLTSGTISLKPV